jgi:hypothetical protein
LEIALYTIPAVNPAASPLPSVPTVMINGLMLHIRADVGAVPVMPLPSTTAPKKSPSIAPVFAPYRAAPMTIGGRTSAMGIVPGVM